MGSIQASNLGKAYKRYPNRWARMIEWCMPGARSRHSLEWKLRGIDFHIPAGQAVAIIGLNGAGKSTLLKLITGVMTPSAGAVRVRGRVAALLELGLGFHPEFTGRQNVLLAGQLAGFSVPHIEALLPEIAAFADIGDYLDQPVRIYSSGMQVRLAFSVATAVRPDILIVDEALAVGDIFFQQKCYERIRSYCAAGTTLLFVSHAKEAVYALCQRAFLLEQGRLVWDGSPREALDLYDLYHAKILGDIAPEAPDASPVPEPSSEADDRALGSFNKEGAVILSATLLVDGRPAAEAELGASAAVRVHAAFTAAFDDVHFGFQIRYSNGEAIFMTNTYCMGHNPGAVAEGEQLVATFPFVMRLAPGEYSITCGLANGGYGEGAFREPLARWQDAHQFRISGNIDDLPWRGLYDLEPVCHVYRDGALPASPPRYL